MEIKVNKSFYKSLERIGSFREKLTNIRYWFKEHFTKDFWRVLKTTLKGNPWCECYMLEMEQAKLMEIANYIEKHNRYIGCEYDVRDMRICIKLIDIILERKDMFHFNGDLVETKLPDGNYEITHTDDFEYICDVKVNTKNIGRFEPRENYQKTLVKYPHELYLLKARYLYNKIRYERGIHWCD